MAQLDPEPVGSLWDAIPPSTPEPHSRAAAASMRAPAGTLRRAVLSSIDLWGPVATWELEAQLKLSGNTVRPRVWELRKAGLIGRVTWDGTTPSGRKCTLYIVTRAGRAEVESWATATR